MHEGVVAGAFPDVQRPRSRGLGAVNGYDPYMRRTFTAFRHALAAGHPIMVRLHSAAQYPAAGSTLYLNDREGHAVLVVGYDDDRGELAVLDPWDAAWGGIHSGLRWMSYAEFSLQVVDGTKPLPIFAAPLQISAAAFCEDSKAAQLEVDVGFYMPECAVMDNDNQAITEVVVSAELPEQWSHGGNAVQRVEGFWTVGNVARVTFPVNIDMPRTVEIDLHVTARVVGGRPYMFSDEISTELTKAVEFRRQLAPRGRSVA